MKTQAALIAMTAMSVSSLAHADIADPGIITPFDNAQVSVTWLGALSSYTGDLTWLNADTATVSPVLFNNKTAEVNDSRSLGVALNEGDRFDFIYEIVAGGLDVFSTAEQRDWNQFRVTEINETTFQVNIEDIRLPRGDADYNDAVFEVSFARTIPAPGSLALLGFGGALMGRRRRA